MARLTPVQQERITTIRGFQRTVEQVKRLVAELDGSRAASTNVITNLCSSIERHLSQMRQRAIATDMSVLGDTAGALSVLAGRPVGIALKIRGLGEGVQSMEIELQGALDRVLAEAKEGSDEPPEGVPPPTGA